MTGIEKIIEQIIGKAEENGKQIMENSKKEALKIIAQAKEEGKAQEQEILEKSEIQSKDIIARGESAAQLHKRKEKLKAKQEIITTMLKKAKEEILTMPEKEYCEIILKMVEKYSTKEAGEIAFNSKDIKRIGSIKKEFKKYNVALSNKEVDIDGGFILIYGDIEENCSITALFEGADEKLQDEVHRIIFSK